MGKLKLILFVCFMLIYLTSCKKYEIIHAGINNISGIILPAESMSVEDDYSLSYIANKNTMRYHYLECHSVKSMKEKNKIYLNCTREEAINAGYKPCKNCNP